ncbi:hypothetical protein COT48_01215 [Candidatus Woesearchaeota archaeon CG08_land_8_20_14_0_20_47_9]|nr:MAG: hypothetical protein AUJ69_04350 [Candidatus Woesearchaeota archaeon CG1_02_47_18]PIN72888.1 MAG: hypothetical protein COV22_02020 [Candidatus Woesearchaeota archaeon CG10_big_fil_rev_8_21_14_0_10_47_5]PIO04281.1 MAG: hypothetical protein COT48_01215 [Candidatus Woesearchaeota archaeon CG08_land_8_20_14_0_20_47_9]HII29460.1 hypothetical protein [Candidatus Woesearchaeota archaeon]
MQSRFRQLHKRGVEPPQGTASAASIVLITAILIVVYILLIPPEEREKLLGDNATTENGNNNNVEVESVLLDETPGTIYKSERDEFEHRMDPVKLFTTTEDSIIKDVSSAYVSRSFSEDKTRDIIFVINDPQNTENALLSFNVEKHRGRLIITLNDNEIFNQEAKEGSAKPIRMDSLGRENIIRFKASNPGIIFWSSSFYQLSDIKVTASISDLKNQRAKTLFIMDENELDNMESGYLNFLVDCKRADKMLYVYLNREEVYSGLPECGRLTKIKLDSWGIVPGKNELVFESEGRYNIEQISVKSELKAPLWPIYYFYVDSDLYKDIKEDVKDATLYMKFAATDDKVADISINNRLIYLDTDKTEYSKVIDSYIVEGNNYIQLVPRSKTLPVVQLKVTVK